MEAKIVIILGILGMIMVVLIISSIGVYFYNENKTSTPTKTPSSTPAKTPSSTPTPQSPQQVLAKYEGKDIRNSTTGLIARVQNGQVRHYPSLEIYESNKGNIQLVNLPENELYILNESVGPVMEFNKNSLSKYEGKDIRNTNGGIYRVENLQLRSYPSMEIYISHNGSAVAPTLNSSELYLFAAPVGPAMTMKV